MNNQEKLEKARNERLGEINKNTFGTKMKIIEYNGNSKTIVEFQDEYKHRKKCSYGQFLKGLVKNPYDKTVFGIGYLGEGKYNKKDYCEIYRIWTQILQRCYDPYKLNECPAYIDCYVCKLWHCFQNFAEWYEKNYYNCNEEKMEVDKDILIKGNKIYSPETCMIVPRRINILFVKQQRRRGKYPIGVSEKYNRKGEKVYLEARCSIFDENKKRIEKHLETFPLSEPFHAFYTYKIFKENYIKQVADEYKDLIPQRLYEAMYKYEVEIND